MEADHPFTPGTEVALVSRGRWTRDVEYIKGKVAKVHKTGRFVLEGNPQQYRAYRDTWTKRWEAQSTSRGYDSYRTVELLTPELEAEVDASRRRRILDSILADIAKLKIAEATAEQIAAARALKQMLTTA